MRSLSSALFLAVVGVLWVLCSSCSKDDNDTGASDADSDSDVDTGVPCEGGYDILQPAPDGEIPTGIEQCSDGTRHRYAALPVTQVGQDEPACEGDCNGDAGCPDDTFCYLYPGGDPGDGGCECINRCATDADCASDEACLWGELAYAIHATRCVRVGCHVDADCAPYECGLSIMECMNSQYLSCWSAADECRIDNDCEDGFHCIYSTEAARWICGDTPDCD